MNVLLPATIAAFLTFRWWGLRGGRTYERGVVASRLLTRILPRAPMPPIRRAILEEFVCWLFAALIVVVLFGVLFTIAMLFGPFRPIHEWIR